MMNLGFDAKRLFHNRSGLGQYSRYVLNHLGHMYPEHTYHLYAGKDSDLFELNDHQNFQKLPSPQAYYRSVDMRSLWKTDGIDVYHGLSNELPLKTGDLPMMVTIHDLLFEDFPMDYPWLDRQIYRYKTRKALEKASAIVTISEKTKEDMVAKYGIDAASVKVVYQSCRPDFFNQRTTAQIEQWQKRHDLTRPYILCVSSFSFRKDQSVLIDAFYHSGLSDTHDLVLIGAPSLYKSSMIRRVNDLKIDRWVKFPDRLDDKDIVTAYQGCSFVVYPSKKEGFGIPVVEAMASQKPVIVRRDTSCAEAGGDAVLTFNGEASNLVDQMLALAEDDALVRDLTEKGIARVEKFSPKVEMPKLMAIYQRLVDPS